MKSKSKSESTVRDIRRRTRKNYSAEEKIRIVLDGLRGEDSIAAICRRVILRTLRDIQLTLFSLFFKISYGVFPLKAPCGLS